MFDHTCLLQGFLKPCNVGHGLWHQILPLFFYCSHVPPSRRIDLLYTRCYFFPSFAFVFESNSWVEGGPYYVLPFAVLGHKDLLLVIPPVGFSLCCCHFVSTSSLTTVAHLDMQMRSGIGTWLVDCHFHEYLWMSFPLSFSLNSNEI